MNNLTLLAASKFGTSEMWFPMVLIVVLIGNVLYGIFLLLDNQNNDLKRKKKGYGRIVAGLLSLLMFYGLMSLSDNLVAKVFLFLLDLVLTFFLFPLVSGLIEGKDDSPKQD